MKDINKNSIDELLIRYLTGISETDEVSEVEKWINVNEDNRIYYQKFKSVWELSPRLKEYEEIDTEGSLENVRKRIDFNSKTEARVKPLWMAMRIAAILVIFFGLYLIFMDKDEILENSKVVKIESFDEIKMLVLPDSTVVTLNLASTIEYPEKFEGKERRVKFEGEAYFEVAPNKSMPFIIETSKSETRVLGTAFNLKAVADEKDESIVVTEGIVEFSSKVGNAQEKVKLEKGEKAVLNSELIKEKNEDPNFMAWKTGVLLFDNLELVNALQVLSEFYQVEFKIKDSVLMAYTLSGRYERLTISELSEVLEMALNIKVEKQDGVYWLKKNSK